MLVVLRKTWQRYLGDRGRARHCMSSVIALRVDVVGKTLHIVKNLVKPMQDDESTWFG